MKIRVLGLGFIEGSIKAYQDNVKPAVLGIHITLSWRLNVGFKNPTPKMRVGLGLSYRGLNNSNRVLGPILL